MRTAIRSFVLTATLAATPVWAGPNLIMVEEPGCVYCRQWEREIGHIYPKTDESVCAPLSQIEMHSDQLGEIETRFPVRFTPTFLLVEDGKEIARLEGYPGEDFFWGLLGMMLDDHAQETSLPVTDPCSVGFVGQNS